MGFVFRFGTHGIGPPRLTRSQITRNGLSRSRKTTTFTRSGTRVSRVFRKSRFKASRERGREGEKMNTKTYSQVMDQAGTFIIGGNYYAAGFVSRASVENGVRLGYPVYAIIRGETFRVILGATFEAGRKYMTSSGEEITVTKRTACYVTYTDGRESSQGSFQRARIYHDSVGGPGNVVFLRSHGRDRF